MTVNLLDILPIQYAGAAVAMASNTDNNSTRIDMLGFEGIIFIVPVTDSANTGVATLRVRST